MDAKRGKAVVRKRLDRDMWTSIKSKHYRQCFYEGRDFNGVVASVEMIEVDPISTWHFPDRSIVVTNKGYIWFQIIPANEYYVITAIMNDKKEIELWYIDMVAKTGFEPDGVAFFDDLFLDLVLRLDGSIMTDDMDELEEAYRNRVISTQEFQLALDTKTRLESGPLADVRAFQPFCERLFHILQNETSPDIDRWVTNS